MSSGARLAERIVARDPLRLLIVKMPCEPQIEIASAVGFDGVIVDTEHGPSGGLELERHIRAADAARIPALVRVPGTDPAAILAALDAGAIGIVVPHIRTAADANAAVDAARYPPEGHRGLALSTRAARFGTRTTQEHLTNAALDTIVIVQIEDGEAVPRADEILRVKGVNAVLIGVTDLSISLGHPGNPSHPNVTAAVTGILETARSAVMPTATVVRTRDEAETWHRSGGTIAIFIATELTAQTFSAVTRSSPGLFGRAPHAEPLVLLPGMLGTEELWSKVAPTLREHVPLRPGRIDLDDSIEEMAETVLASAPDRFALAAHSLGAIVALEIARRAPSRVSRLALLNSSARPGNEEQRRTWQQMQERTEAGGFDEFTTEFAHANLEPHHAHDEALVARMASMARTVGRQGFLRQLSAQLARPDSRPTLQTIAAPTLVVSGEADPISLPVLQHELANGIPGARLARIESCGHMSPLEAPEKVAALLQEWLTHGRS
jgi:4-hydroxy-2-oxoheptanedioate aldolase